MSELKRKVEYAKAGLTYFGAVANIVNAQSCMDEMLHRIEALERENARLRDINAILEDCMSKGMVIRKKETE